MWDVTPTDMLAKPGEVTPTNLDWPALKELIAKYVTFQLDLCFLEDYWFVAFHHRLKFLLSTRDFLLESNQIFNKRILQPFKWLGNNLTNVYVY